MWCYAWQCNRRNKVVSSSGRGANKPRIVKLFSPKSVVSLIRKTSLFVFTSLIHKSVKIYPFIWLWSTAYITILAKTFHSWFCYKIVAGIANGYMCKCCSCALIWRRCYSMNLCLAWRELDKNLVPRSKSPIKCGSVRIIASRHNNHIPWRLHVLCL